MKIRIKRVYDGPIDIEGTSIYKEGKYYYVDINTLEELIALRNHFSKGEEDDDQFGNDFIIGTYCSEKEITITIWDDYL